jgi:hypothetical protein
MTTNHQSGRLLPARRDDFTYDDVINPSRLVERIRAGVDVNAPIQAQTPLAIAAGAGKVESCRILLNAGADPDRAHREPGKPSVLCELFEGRLVVLNKLDPANAHTVPDEAMTAICTMLVEYGANPNGLVEPGVRLKPDHCPLYVAAGIGDVKWVDVLVSLGADVNRICCEKWSMPEKTALADAKDRADEGMMVALLRLGASDDWLRDHDSGSTKHLTAFQNCVLLGYNEVVEYYVRERGEDLRQSALISGQEKALVDLSLNTRTRELLLFLETEKAIHGALTVPESGAQPAIKSTKTAGVSPL